MIQMMMLIVLVGIVLGGGTDTAIIAYSQDSMQIMPLFHLAMAYNGMNTKETPRLLEVLSWRFGKLQSLEHITINRMLKMYNAPF